MAGRDGKLIIPSDIDIDTHNDFEDWNTTEYDDPEGWMRDPECERVIKRECVGLERERLKL